MIYETLEGQMTIFDFLDDPNEKKVFKIDKPIRLIELFAGIGSQAMALRDIGANFEHYRVVEFDKYAIASYNAIHGTNFPTMDVTKIKGDDLGISECDKFTYLLTYSFPCTDLSVAGKMQGMAEGSGTHSSLLWEVRRLLDECEELPRVLLMENVPQVHSKKNMPHFQKWLDFLKEKGYSTYWQDMNAKNYGVAQSRNRTIAVSILGNYEFQFPTPYPLNKVMKDYLQDEVEEKYYLKSEKARDLIDKLIIGGKIQTDRQTDRQSTCVRNKLKQLQLQIALQQDMMLDLSTTSMNTVECVKLPCVIEKNSHDGKSLGMKWLRLEKVGGIDVANTLTTHNPELSQQHCNLIIEVEKNG